MIGRGGAAELTGAFVLILVGATTVLAQGLVPRGRQYTYLDIVDSVTVTVDYAYDFADTNIYEGIVLEIPKRTDVIEATWRGGLNDGLVQYYYNGNPASLTSNVAHLVGYELRGQRVFYDPPIPWVPSGEQLAAGFSWQYVGLSNDPQNPALDLRFEVEGQEPLDLPWQSPVQAWKMGQSAPVALVVEAQARTVGLDGSVLGSPLADPSRRVVEEPRWYAVEGDRGINFPLVQNARHQLIAVDPLAGDARSLGTLKGDFSPPRRPRD